MARCKAVPELFNRIEIKGLFGTQDEMIEFVEDDNIKIIYGLNGSGKTTILRVIESLIEWNPISLMRCPFHSVTMTREEILDSPNYQYGFFEFEKDEVPEKLWDKVTQFHDPLGDDATIHVELSVRDQYTLEIVRHPNPWVRRFQSIDPDLDHTPFGRGNIPDVEQLGFIFEFNFLLERVVVTESKEHADIIDELRTALETLRSDVGFCLGGTWEERGIFRMPDIFDFNDEDWERISREMSDQYSIELGYTTQYGAIQDLEDIDVSIHSLSNLEVPVDVSEFIQQFVPPDLLPKAKTIREWHYDYDPEETEVGTFNFNTDYYAYPLIKDMPNLVKRYFGRLSINQDRSAIYENDELSHFSNMLHKGPYPTNRAHPPNLIHLTANRTIADSKLQSSEFRKLRDKTAIRFGAALTFLKKQATILSDYLEDKAWGSESTRFLHIHQKDTSGLPDYNYLAWDLDSEISLCCIAIGSVTQIFQHDWLGLLQKSLHKLDAASIGYISHLEAALELKPVGSERIYLKDHSIDIRNVLAALEILESLNLLNNVIENRLPDKTVELSNEGYIIIRDELGRELQPNHLSSGERQLILLYWSTLFQMKREEFENLVLIDEPELSLHISWQRDVVDDLHHLLIDQSKYGDLSDGGFPTKIIIATHSPQVLANNFHLGHELGNSEGA